jgi:hypothetical protein
LGFGTVMLPNPMYTIGLPSALALAIQSIRVAGGVQFNSGFSKNQLHRKVMSLPADVFDRIKNSLAGDGCGISPIKGFGHDSL